MPRGIYIKSEEHKRKLGLANAIALRGRSLSEEHKRNISEATKGEKNPAWKGGIWKTSNYHYYKKYNRKWREKNKEHVRKYKNEYNKKWQRNPRNRIDHNMATAIWEALKDKKAGRKWEKLVGYTLEDLIKHLEKQFNDKMVWQNYGSYWWIDHIIPRSHFRYETAEGPEFKQCWALENLQPLEKIANIRKGNRY